MAKGSIKTPSEVIGNVWLIKMEYLQSCLRTQGKLEEYKALFNLGEASRNVNYSRCLRLCLETVPELEEAQKHHARTQTKPQLIYELLSSNIFHLSK